MTLPIIGIMCCNRVVGHDTAQAVMDRYVRAALTYGDCGALLIPAMTEGFDPHVLTSRLDGLMLTGSPSNVQPGLYGETEADRDENGPFDKNRDHISLRMIETMVERGKPVFGICRGFQEINVALGGTLRRDVGFGSRQGANRIDHHAPDGTSFEAQFDHCHTVALTTDGILSNALNIKELIVNSVHYQGVDKLAPGLDVEAIAPDGQVEAVSANIAGSQVLAVQWHPEWQASQHPDRQAFFRLMGQALRGVPLDPS
jgi:putative glutamine amidotransferase